MTHSADIIAKTAITQCMESGNPISNLKLQKILYFAWVDFCKNTGGMLFQDEICAWQLGPVVPSVYFDFCVFGGKPIVRRYDTVLQTDDALCIKEIIDHYGAIPASRLVDMSHSPGGAWDTIYRDGSGNREVIPFGLIRRIECGC